MKKLQEKLEKRQENGNLRELFNNEGLKDFYSNDYLGLAQNEDLYDTIKRVSSDIREVNKNGSTGSRLLSGNNLITQELEDKLAQIFKAEKCLLFNSGYNANLSILSAVPQKGDTIILDELIHASLKESARLSFAQHYTFKHNNLENLKKKLNKASGNKFVVVESIYSMDGDIAPLEEIADICNKFNAYLIVDEAHSTGIMGTSGNGMVCALNLEDNIFARIHTFGKAIGVHGACIAGSEVLINYLINFARPFIYTTALPPHSIISINEAFSFLSDHMELQTQIQNKINLFSANLKNSLPESYIFRSSKTPIQVLDIPGNENARTFAGNLQKDGFNVRPILSPTVRTGEERLRICLHVFNTDEEISHLTESIVRNLRKLNFI